MSDVTLTEIAQKLIDAFLLSLGIFPIEGEDDDTFEWRDYGPHRVYTQMVRVPDRLADSIDPGDTLDKLLLFLNNYKRYISSSQISATQCKGLYLPLLWDLLIHQHISYCINQRLHTGPFLIPSSSKP